MEPFGLGCYFEDLPVGRKMVTMGRTLTEADMVAFCNCTGLTGEVEVALTACGRQLDQLDCVPDPP